eukprot:scaffold3920_cov134-Isochrysis_galbana.AAC.11
MAGTSKRQSRSVFNLLQSYLAFLATQRSAMASPADARGLAPPHAGPLIGPAHLIFDDTIMTTTF